MMIWGIAELNKKKRGSVRVYYEFEALSAQGTRATALFLQNCSRGRSRCHNQSAFLALVGWNAVILARVGRTIKKGQPPFQTLAPTLLGRFVDERLVKLLFFC
jgi:hypothetical protein